MGKPAIGIEGSEQFRQMVNVESTAGNSLIQHDPPKLLTAYHTHLYSDNSRGLPGAGKNIDERNEVSLSGSA